MFCLRVANITHHCVLSKKCPYDKPEWQEHCDLDEKPPGLLPAYQEALPLATALHSFTVTVGVLSSLTLPVCFLLPPLQSCVWFPQHACSSPGKSHPVVCSGRSEAGST